MLTPEPISNLVRTWFGGAIALDPAATVDLRDTVAAARQLYGTVGAPDDDGLLVPWIDRTYVNPPYAQLRGWLEKAVIEAGHNRAPRIVVLAPVRSRSRWWRAARDVAYTCGAVVELDRITFLGYSASFPESLVLLCFHVGPEVVTAGLSDYPIGTIIP